jgi:hypothetical protein
MKVEKAKNIIRPILREIANPFAERVLARVLSTRQDRIQDRIDDMSRPRRMTEEEFRASFNGTPPGAPHAEKQNVHRRPPKAGMSERAFKNFLLYAGMVVVFLLFLLYARNR